VGVDELQARNWNLDCKNPHVGELRLDDPDALLESYADIQKEIQTMKKQLRALLQESFE
jgi:type I restriction enzyme M protein